MSEYLESLEPNDAQCYIKKLTLTTGGGGGVLTRSIYFGCSRVGRKYQVSRYYSVQPAPIMLINFSHPRKHELPKETT